jgi:hypothetical protein
MDLAAKKAPSPRVAYSLSMPAAAARRNATLIAWSAAIVAALAAGTGATLLAADDLSRDSPTWLSGGAGARAFVGTAAVVAGAIAFLLVRRLLGHRATTRRGWILSLPRVVPSARDYRAAAPPSIADLVSRLEARGYQLDAAAVDDANEERGSIDRRTALGGATFRLRDSRLGPAGTGVIVKISPRVGDEGGGLGLVEARDARGDACEELARFAIVELAALVPGLTYRPDDSALSLDDVDSLRAALPDRPRALP